MSRKIAKRPPPHEVERAVSLWLIAVGVAVAETLLQVARAFATEPAPGALVWDAAIRMLLYTGLWALVLRLRRGERWLRITLTVVLGVFGLLSMIVPVLMSMAGGYSILDFFAESDAWSLMFAVLRCGHIAAAVLALVAMFQPEANRFFLQGQQVSAPGRSRPPRRAAAPARRPR